MLGTKGNRTLSSSDGWRGLGPARFVGHPKGVGNGLTDDEVKRLDGAPVTGDFDFGKAFGDAAGKVGGAVADEIDDILHPKAPDAPKASKPDHTMLFVVGGILVVGIIAAVYVAKG